jgi:hypothetical protein
MNRNNYINIGTICRNYSTVVDTAAKAYCLPIVQRGYCGAAVTERGLSRRYFIKLILFLGAADTAAYRLSIGQRGHCGTAATERGSSRRCH